jgi:hypothetical protein
MISIRCLPLVALLALAACGTRDATPTAAPAEYLKSAGRPGHGADEHCRTRRLMLRSPEKHRRQHVAVLTYGLWNSRFGADPSLVGRTVRLNGEEYAVVGVMPADFELPAREGFHPGALRVHAAADVRPGAGQRVQRDGRETAA